MVFSIFGFAQSSLQSSLEHFCHPQKEALYPLAITPSFPPPGSSSLTPARSRQPLFDFLSPWISLFWTVHLNRMIQYVLFCAWILLIRKMFSKFIHAGRDIYTFFLLLLNNIPFCRYTHFIYHPSLDGCWVVSSWTPSYFDRNLAIFDSFLAFWYDKMFRLISYISALDL